MNKLTAAQRFTIRIALNIKKKQHSNVDWIFKSNNLSTVQEMCCEASKKFGQRIILGNAPEYFVNMYREMLNNKTHRYFKTPFYSKQIGQKSWNYRFSKMLNSTVAPK